MDQAPNRSTGNPATATSGVSPAMSAWDDYYKEASRRRRAYGGSRQLRVEKRRRRWRERIGIALSALLVGAMTVAFYLVLR
jgi:predicted membrane-bound mannosyltransferase